MTPPSSTPPQRPPSAPSPNLFLGAGLRPVFQQPPNHLGNRGRIRDQGVVCHTQGPSGPPQWGTYMLREGGIFLQELHHTVGQLGEGEAERG